MIQMKLKRKPLQLREVLPHNFGKAAVMLHLEIVPAALLVHGSPPNAAPCTALAGACEHPRHLGMHVPHRLQLCPLQMLTRIGLNLPQPLRGCKLVLSLLLLQQCDALSQPAALEKVLPLE